MAKKRVRHKCKPKTYPEGFGKREDTAERGPKKIQIDWNQFDELCRIQCTQDEIASVLGCSVDTLERAVLEVFGVKFADRYAEKSKDGKASLRRAQLSVALDGNPALLIWLGKNWLKQADNPVDDADHDDRDAVFTNLDEPDPDPEPATIEAEDVH